MLGQLISHVARSKLRAERAATPSVSVADLQAMSKAWQGIPVLRQSSAFGLWNSHGIPRQTF